jgi:DNA repair exonuclease SbcCD ATPase subunit
MSEETRKSLDESNKACTKDFQKTLGMKEDIDKLTKEMSGLKEGDPKLAELKSKRQEMQLKYEVSLKETKQEYQKMISRLPEAQRKELQQSEKKVSTAANELSRLNEQKEKDNKNYSTEMNSFKQERQELQNRLKGMDPKSAEYNAAKQKLNNLETKIDKRVQEHNKLENTLYSKEKETIQLRQNLEVKRQEFGVSININKQLTPEQQKKAKAVEAMYAGTVPKAGSAVEDILTRASVTKELAKSSMSVKELEEAKNIGTTITVASKEKGIAALGGTEKKYPGLYTGNKDSPCRKSCNRNCHS